MSDELKVTHECDSVEQAAELMIKVYNTGGYEAHGKTIYEKSAGQTGYVPHVTVTYGEPGEPGPAPIEQPLTFQANTVSLVIGGKRTDYTMGNETKDVGTASPVGGPPLGFAPIQRGVDDEEEEDEKPHEHGDIVLPPQRIPLEPRRVPRPQKKADAGSAGTPVPSAPNDGRGDSSGVRSIPDERHHRLRLGAWENALANLLHQHFDRQERVVKAKLTGAKNRERWEHGLASRPVDNQCGSEPDTNLTESKREQPGTVTPVRVKPPVEVGHVFDKETWKDALKADTSGMVRAIWDDFGQDAADTYGVDWTIDTPDIDSAIGTQIAGLLHIEDTTEDQIAKALEKGFHQGDGIQSLMERVGGVFDSARLLRAPMIAQQQTVAAGNGAIVNVGKQSDGEFQNKTWHCVVGSTQVAIPLASQVSRRWYEGTVMVITTRAGNVLTITANHPVLTTHGWVRADEVDIGDDLVRYRFPERMVGTSPDEENVPAEGIEIPRTAEEVWTRARMMGGVMNLYVDREGREIEVIDIHSKLRDDLQTPLRQPGSEEFLTCSDSDLCNLPSLSGGAFMSDGLGSTRRSGRNLGSPKSALGRILTSHSVDTSSRLISEGNTMLLEDASDRRLTDTPGSSEGTGGLSTLIASDELINVRHDNLANADTVGVEPSEIGCLLVGRELSKLQSSTLCPGTHCDTRLPEASLHGLFTSTHVHSDLGGGLSRFVALDQILNIERNVTTCHVYDFSSNGWYIADNLVVHNSQEDEKVREWHNDADGQTVPVDAQFSVGPDMMDYPGDPSASIENCANCRCWATLSPPTVTPWEPASPEERAAQDIMFGKSIPVFAISRKTLDLPTIEFKYNPDQPRGADGRFGSSLGDESPELSGVLWSFGSESQRLTSAAAALVKDPGEFYPDPDESQEYLKLAGQMMDKIDSMPPTKQPLFSGHTRPVGSDVYKVGDEMTIPLMASTLNSTRWVAENYSQGSRSGAGVMSDRNPDPEKDDVLQALQNAMGPKEGYRTYRDSMGSQGMLRYSKPYSQATMLRFSSTTPSAFYQHGERLISGRFKVTSVEEHPVEGNGKWIDEDGTAHPVMDRTVNVRYLGPAARGEFSTQDDRDYDDYDEKSRPVFRTSVKGFDPSEPRDERGRWGSSTGGQGTGEPLQPAVGRVISIDFEVSGRMDKEQLGKFLDAQKAGRDFLNSTMGSEDKAGELKAQVASDLTSRFFAKYGDKFDDELLAESGCAPEDGISMDDAISDWQGQKAYVSASPDGRVRLEFADPEHPEQPDDDAWGDMATSVRLANGELTAADSDEGRQMIRTAAMNQIVANWAKTSNDSYEEALAMQDAVQQEFGLDGAAEWEEDPNAPVGNITATSEAQDKIPLFRAVARTMYDNTQDWFKKQGITSMLVHRGVAQLGVDADTEEQGDWPTGLEDLAKMDDKNPSEVSVNLRPMSSWTADGTVAKGFSGGFVHPGKGAVMSAVVPVGRVIGTPFTGLGCMGESELVLLGGQDKVGASRL